VEGTLDALGGPSENVKRGGGRRALSRKTDMKDVNREVGIVTLPDRAREKSHQYPEGISPKRRKRGFGREFPVA